MKRVFLLLLMLMVTFPFMAGCGGGAPKEKEQTPEETQAAMDQGMDAMKKVEK